MFDVTGDPEVMSAHLQGSLSDQSDTVRLGPPTGLRRTVPGDGAWIDLLPGRLHGADEVFTPLAGEVPRQAAAAGCTSRRWPYLGCRPSGTGSRRRPVVHPENTDGPVAGPLYFRSPFLM